MTTSGVFTTSDRYHDSYWDVVGGGGGMLDTSEGNHEYIWGYLDLYGEAH